MMCRLKEGAYIKTYADLQNLISNIILRQTTEFSLEDLYQQVEEKLKGSDLCINSIEIYNQCHEALSTLFSIGYIEPLEDLKHKLTINISAIN